MNYKKIYDSLIEKCRQRMIVEGCVERHHIIPRCLGGEDSRENIVSMTPEEHYVAHQLLVKIHPKNYRLSLAAHMMTVNRPSNKMYGWLKRRHRKSMSESQSGSNNSQHGKKWIHNNVLKVSKKIYKNDSLPEGWNEGRKLDFTEKNVECKFCKNKFTPSKNTKYCSDKCRQYDDSEAIYIIDKNLDDILQKFSLSGSINGVLKEYGLSGRQGNGYLSRILKQKNLKVLKRRNS